MLTVQVFANNKSNNNNNNNNKSNNNNINNNNGSVSETRLSYMHDNKCNRYFYNS